MSSHTAMTDSISNLFSPPLSSDWKRKIGNVITDYHQNSCIIPKLVTVTPQTQVNRDYFLRWAVVPVRVERAEPENFAFGTRQLYG